MPDMIDLVLEGAEVLRACTAGYGEAYPHFGAHDAMKRLYRMGWRKVAAPELSTCRHCGREGVVTSQSVCIDCVGKPARP